MILHFKSRYLDVFAANQSSDYDIATDEFREVRPGFRVALFIQVKGKPQTWVWEGLTVKRAKLADG